MPVSTNHGEPQDFEEEEEKKKKKKETFSGWRPEKQQITEKSHMKVRWGSVRVEQGALSWFVNADELNSIH